MANRFYSPLRYPGGKLKLTPFIKSVLSENFLVGCDYIEPFAGGASVALSLLFDGYVKSITINDLDRSIYAFWHSAVHKNKALCEKIEKTPISVREWKKQKEVQYRKRVDRLTLGFSTFYLNRTNVSGVISGGIIGGKFQNGKYKIDARFNKANLIDRIIRIGEYKNQITVSNEDAKVLLQRSFQDRFVYIDPPYVQAKNLYMSFFEEKDHRDISRILLSRQANFKWLLSYDRHNLIQNLYSSCKNTLSWNLHYGISNKRMCEDIFLHKDIQVKNSMKMLGC